MSKRKSNVEKKSSAAMRPCDLFLLALAVIVFPMYRMFDRDNVVKFTKMFSQQVPPKLV